MTFETSAATQPGMIKTWPVLLATTILVAENLTFAADIDAIPTESGACVVYLENHYVASATWEFYARSICNGKIFKLEVPSDLDRNDQAFNQTLQLSKFLAKGYQVVSCTPYQETDDILTPPGPGGFKASWFAGSCLLTKSAK